MDQAEVRRLATASADLQRRFCDENASLLLEVGQRISAALRAGGKLLAFGNGGSAADAQHLAGELVGRYLRERAALPALALTTDPSVVTAVGNDLGFDAVFRRQVEAHGRSGDVAFGISTSGRSPNVLEAMRAARERGLLTVGLTGQGGGRLRELCDHLIAVPSTDTPRIQEVHGLVIHLVCQIVEEGMDG